MTNENLLLRSLPASACEELLSLGTLVDLPVRAQLRENDGDQSEAFFVLEGLVSLVVHMADGNSAEVSLIGREGLVGVFSLLGPTACPAESVMQIAGRALRVRVADLRRVFTTSEPVRNRVLEFVQQQWVSTSQLAACNRLHRVEERLARWLLMCADRTGLQSLHLTQEFLSEMLGVRRSTVTIMAGGLQRAGLIEYVRGSILILDRKRLQAAACDCYGIIKAADDRLYTQA